MPKWKQKKHNRCRNWARHLVTISNASHNKDLQQIPSSPISKHYACVELHPSWLAKQTGMKPQKKRIPTSHIQKHNLTGGSLSISLSLSRSIAKQKPPPNTTKTHAPKTIHPAHLPQTPLTPDLLQTNPRPHYFRAIRLTSDVHQIWISCENTLIAKQPIDKLDWQCKHMCRMNTWQLPMGRSVHNC